MSEFNQAEYRRLKTRLTLKSNKLRTALTLAQSRDGRSGAAAVILHAVAFSRDGRSDAAEAIIAAARALIEETKDALSRFEQTGYPDDWSRWERAKDDAQTALGRLGVAA